MLASAASAVLVAAPAARAQTTLYQFTGPLGASPAARMLEVSCGSTNYLYGTTQYGGAYGNGEVFNYNLGTGALTVVHSFTGSATDGGNPTAGLIRVGTILFGTTEFGGSYGIGTVYRFPIGTCGAAAPVLIHSFTGSPDGDGAAAGLLYYGGYLYGTTVKGGTAGVGAVYQCNLTNACKVIYSFTGGTDGAVPFSSLIFAGTSGGGTGLKGLFGTTYGGGANNAGTIYAIPFPLTGHDRVLWTFTGNADGGYPTAELLNLGRYMYGTAEYGGTGNCQCGTVFRFNPASLSMAWIHSFGGSPADGSSPSSGLLWDGAASPPALYGTTSGGGAYSVCFSGCGTVFKIGLGGTGEALDFSFDNTVTGEYPSHGFALFGGTLYGTSYAGIGSGSGTVFSTPP